MFDFNLSSGYCTKTSEVWSQKPSFSNHIPVFVVVLHNLFSTTISPAPRKLPGTCKVSHTFCVMNKYINDSLSKGHVHDSLSYFVILQRQSKISLVKIWVFFISYFSKRKAKITNENIWGFWGEKIIDLGRIPIMPEHWDCWESKRTCCCPEYWGGQVGVVSWACRFSQLAM